MSTDGTDITDSEVSPELEKVNEFLEDLFDRRGLITVGGNPHNFVELEGGEMVLATAFEPDPNTFRGEYYYNVVTNQLFKRIIDIDVPEEGLRHAHWRAISN